MLAGRDSTGNAKDVDRAKLVRERQNEERQRKLEELRQQALAAQRFREQREEERRRRIDELRSRDSDRWNEIISMQYFLPINPTNVLCATLKRRIILCSMRSEAPDTNSKIAEQIIFKQLLGDSFDQI